jgi:hypothetical protein
LFKELTLFEEYPFLHARIERALKGRDEQAALDTLGHEIAPEWEIPNPNNRPIPGYWLQRHRIDGFAIDIWNNERSRDALNELAGITMLGQTGECVVRRNVTLYLAYQMQWRSRIAVERVGAEKAGRQIVALKKGKIPGSLTELRRFVTRVNRIVGVVELTYNCNDPIRPPDALLRNLEEALAYLAMFERDKPRLWPGVIGAPGEGTDEELGKGSALGAFAAIMRALAGKAFTDERLAGLVADLAGAALGMKLDYEAVIYRRSVFLKNRRLSPR